MNIVGISGNAGVGKDTFARELHFYGFHQYAFADPIKDICKAAFKFTDNDFLNRELKEQLDHFWKISPRVAAQKVGTEMFRMCISEDFWVRRLELELMHRYRTPADVKIVISDVRFQNEADWIVSRGGKIIHLTRPGYDGKVGITNHESEAGINFTDSTKFIKGENYYEVANDGSISDLNAKARFFFISAFTSK